MSAFTVAAMLRFPDLFVAKSIPPIQAERVALNPLSQSYHHSFVIIPPNG
jgi:hypothetical protein